jgi:plasmid stability protein
MSTITIPDLDDDLMRLLQLRAAQSGRSLEDEALSILQIALADHTEDRSGAALYTAIRARVEPWDGVELDLPIREAQPDPLDFGEQDAQTDVVDKLCSYFGCRVEDLVEHVSDNTGD